MFNVKTRRKFSVEDKLQTMLNKNILRKFWFLREAKIFFAAFSFYGLCNMHYTFFMVMCRQLMFLVRFDRQVYD